MSTEPCLVQNLSINKSEVDVKTKVSVKHPRPRGVCAQVQSVVRAVRRYLSDNNEEKNSDEKSMSWFGILKNTTRQRDGKVGNSRLLWMWTEQGDPGSIVHPKTVKRNHVRFEITDNRHEEQDVSQTHKVTRREESVESYWQNCKQESERWKQWNGIEGPGQDQVLYIPRTETETIGVIPVGDRFRMMRSLQTKGSFKKLSKYNPIDIHVDPGAGGTLIHEKHVGKEGWKTLESGEKFKLMGAGGASMQVLGVTEIHFGMGDARFKTYALVMKGMQPDFILGMDFLAQAKAKLDFGTGKMEIPGVTKSINIEWGQKNNKTKDTQVYNLKHTVIKPREVAAIPVKVAGTEGRDVIIRPVDLYDKVKVANTLSTIREGMAICQIINTSNQEIKIKPGEVVGTYEEDENLEEEVVYWSQMEAMTEVMENGSNCYQVKRECQMEKQLEHEGFGVDKIPIDHQQKESRENAGGIVTESEFKERLKHLTPAQRQKVWEAVKPSVQVLIKGQFMPTPAKDVVAHMPTGDLKPIAQTPYRYSPEKRIIVNECVQALLDQGVVEPSLSPWAAPVVLAEKPGQPGKWRLCIDYRKLNKMSEAIIWPMPRIDESVEQLQKARYLTSIDLAWGFWGLPLDEESKQKSAFITQDQHLQWRRLPMGWHGSPAIFQKAMDMLTVGIKGVYSLCYVDDLLVFSESLDEHIGHLREVFQRLAQAGRSVRLEKVQWVQEQVKFLGFQVGKGKVTPIEEKVDAVLELPPPKTISELRSFLGAAGVYRKFIRGFAALAAPLYRVLTVGKEKPDEFESEEFYEAFVRVKCSLQQMTALYMPNQSQPFHLITNATENGLYGMLVQEEDGQLKPLKFVSRMLKKKEKRDCSAPEWELLALDYALQQVRPITDGKMIKVHIQEDDLEWATDPMNVVGLVRQAALRVGAMKWERVKDNSMFQKAQQLFRYQEPVKLLHHMRTAKKKQQVQQHKVKLEEYPMGKKVSKGTWVMAFDGGFRRSVQMGAYGWAIWKVEEQGWNLKLAKTTRYQGDTCSTSNWEEFKGLRDGLQAVDCIVPKGETVQIFGDSELVVGIVQGKRKCHASRLKQEWEAIQDQLQRNHHQCKFWHVTREYNKTADFLVNLGMELPVEINEITFDEDSVGYKTIKHTNTLERWTKVENDTEYTNGGIMLVRTRAQEQRQGEIREKQESTPWMNDMIRWLEEGELPEDQERAEKVKRNRDMYIIKENRLWQAHSKGEASRLVIPESMREEVLREHHSNPLAGHLRGERYYNNIRKRYFWPGMMKDVIHFEQSCETCQAGKQELWRQKAPLQLSQLPKKPRQSWAVDYITNLPITVNGNKHILVFVDTFSRWPEVISVPDLRMKTFVDAFIDVIVCRHGCPSHLVSDRGGQFVGDLAMAIYQRLRVKKHTTTAYHPMSNGLCERFNQTLIRGLKTTCNSYQNNWDRMVDPFLFAYRTSVHPVTKFSPFQLMTGETARVPYDVMLLDSEDASAGNYKSEFKEQVDRLHMMRAVAREQMLRAQERNARQYNKKIAKKKDALSMQAGDMVWLWNPAVPTGTKRKLKELWHGPFKITKKISDVNFKIETPAGSRMHDVVHKNRLAPYVDRAKWPKRPAEDQEMGKTPHLTESEYQEIRDEDNREVELQEQCIVKERVIRNANGTFSREYLVKTQYNDGREEQEWIGEERIKDGTMLWDFQQQQQQLWRKYVPVDKLEVVEERYRSPDIEYNVETMEFE